MLLARPPAAGQRPSGRPAPPGGPRRVLRPAGDAAVV